MTEIVVILHTTIAILVFIGSTFHPFHNKIYPNRIPISLALLYVMFGSYLSSAISYLLNIR